MLCRYHFLIFRANYIYVSSGSTVGMGWGQFLHRQSIKCLSLSKVLFTFRALAHGCSPWIKRKEMLLSLKKDFAPAHASTNLVRYYDLLFYTSKLFMFSIIVFCSLFFSSFFVAQLRIRCVWLLAALSCSSKDLSSTGTRRSELVRSSRPGHRCDHSVARLFRSL